VVERDGTLVGTISTVDVEQALAGSAEGTAGKFVHEVPELRADQTLEDAMWMLAATDDEGLPVLDPDGKTIVGWLTHRGLLNAYRARAGRSNEWPPSAGRDSPRPPSRSD
jgi:chloride channel protein, CIC family